MWIYIVPHEGEQDDVRQVQELIVRVMDRIHYNKKSSGRSSKGMDVSLPNGTCEMSFEKEVRDVIQTVPYPND